MQTAGPVAYVQPRPDLDSMAYGQPYGAPPPGYGQPYGYGAPQPYYGYPR